MQEILIFVILSFIVAGMSILPAHKALDKIKSEIAGMTVVNGYSLAVMESIINGVYALAEHYVHIDLINQDLDGPAAKKFDTGFADEKVGEEKPPIRLPQNIQDELEHVFKWTNTPTRGKFFCSHEELFAFLDTAMLRVRSYRSA